MQSNTKSNTSPLKLYPYKVRNYECRECGNKIQTGTNHRADCYPVCKGSCRQIINPNTAREIVLSKQTAHKYIGEITQ